MNLLGIWTNWKECRKLKEEIRKYQKSMNLSSFFYKTSASFDIIKDSGERE